MLRGIEDQREHFDNLGLHIGYIYGDTSNPSNASSYAPAFVPGARLPHAWITAPPSSSLINMPAIDSSYVAEFTPTEIQARQFSTLDLCAFDAFTLIIDKSASGRWQAVIEGAAPRLPRALRINIVILGKDFELMACRRAAEWVEKLHLDEGGGALVRPDQHILETWRGIATTEEVFATLAEHSGL